MASKKQINIPIFQEFLKKISTAYYINLIISVQNAIYSVLSFGRAHYALCIFPIIFYLVHYSA